MVLRHHHPADAPAGHREVFRERIDDIDIVGKFQRAHPARAVMQAVVDFIRDQADAALLRRRHQCAQCLVVEHRAGRVAGAGHHQPGKTVGQIARHRLEPVRRRGLDAHRGEAKRREDLAIGGIAGIAEPHPVATVEQGGESEDEGPRRAGGDHNAGRVEIDAIPVGIEPGDPGAQLRQAEGNGVAQRPGLHRACQRRPRGGRRRGAGLTHFHVDDVAPRRLGGPRRLHHVHHNEGINLGTP